MTEIWDLISRVFQSNSQGLSTDKFSFGITSVRLPEGRGRNRKYNTFDEECAMRRGIVVIKNFDNYCLPRALIVAIAAADKDPDFEKIRRDTGKMQTLRTKQLMEETNICIPDSGAGIPELKQFQKYLSGYKITVYQYGSRGKDVIFEGQSKGKSLNLLYHQNHYNVIRSLTAAFSCIYYCEDCHQSYDHKNHHRCGGTCPCCQLSPACAKDVENIFCQDCNRNFRGAVCFDNHTKAGLLEPGSICSKIKRCELCLKTYKANKTHVCGEVFCKVCKKHVPPGHLCYIQQDTRKPVVNGILFIFYDLETRQEKVINEKVSEGQVIGQTKVHEPNLCVFTKRCDKCIEDNTLYFCQRCGFRTEVYEDNVIERFIKYILEIRKKFKKVIVIAHNGQAFDHQFVFNRILHQTDIKPEVIMRGTKIILMQLDNVKFIDSLNYFPMALSKLPRAFDLPTTYKKGYFPHLFNTLQNQGYIGTLPSVEYYNADAMKTDEREEFLKWYEEHKSDHFQMRQELIEYCISDVQILTEACLKFRRMMLEECNVCPFSEATTIASACNLVFRRNFLKPSTIGIIPKCGYRNGDNQSKAALQWLILEEKNRNINIVHSAKQREVILNGVKVDGYCPETNQIFEFYGCYYHGHPVCLKHERNHPVHEDPTDTLNRRYETTLSRADRLRSFGFEVIEMWECEFRDRMKTNKEEMNYAHSHPIMAHTPLNPRESFYGGRTGNTYKYYKCKIDEKIKYIDVCSLYPWVCKNGKFPVGHPKVIIGDNDCHKLDLKQTDGIMKCKILPPQNVQHPVLPIKQNKKLMFSLCRVCSEGRNQLEEYECGHSDEKRALTGTWIIDEIKAALERGYKLLEIYEIWSYEIEQYNQLTSSGGLFTEMMNKFMKMKQQASGWPSKCRTQEEKDKYLEDFLRHEGIQLEFHEIVNNPGLRSLAKLILNSFWGKFGQRENQTKTSIIKQPDEFYSFFTNPSVEVCHVLPINEEAVIINWQYKEEAAESLSTVNVCIAAYTTAQARLKLHSYLERLGERVLYYDTDSVIYISREGEYEPSTGEFVGDMTDELESYGIGSYITEFVCGGPKSYAYKVYSTTENKVKTVCKVKGICLNYNASQLVNFNTIKDIILNEKSEGILICSNNIRRTADHEVVTVPEVKNYSPKSEKRKFLPDHSSVPYGFKKTRI